MILQFKFSNRGYRGYNGLYCRAYLNNKLVGSCGGGGYDMRGVALAEWVNNKFSGKLKNISGIYGLENGHIDGATGLNQVFSVLSTLGYTAYCRGNNTYEFKKINEYDLSELSKSDNPTISRHAKGLIKELNK